MKKLLFILFIIVIYIPQAFSYTCRNKLTGATIGATGEVKISIPINSEIERGMNIFGNVGDYVECKNEQPYWSVDHLELVQNGIIPGPAISNLDSGVIINGTPVLASNAPKTEIFTLKDSAYYPVNLDMFFIVSQDISSNLVIEAGTSLMTLNLYRYDSPTANNNGYQGVPQNYKWTFLAQNKAVLQVGNCEVNNNEPIVVDFGLVVASRIKNTGDDSVNKDVTLDIDCHNTSINKQIKVTLNAQPTSFSSDFIAVTDNTNLGVEIAHNNQVVKPFSGFLSFINNGLSSEQIRVSVVKKPTVNASDLSLGAFNANGSLIISEP